MKHYIEKNAWKIIERGFNPEYNKITESLCSIGNGKMGGRGNFEESYSGKSLQGTYYAGIYYPDKTKVGWWKNGYPEYFAKVLNGCNWIGLKLVVGDCEVDIHQAKIESFYRELNMQEGLLTRTCKLTLNNNAQVEIKSQRFCSLHHDEIAALSYSLKVDNFTGPIKIESFLDFDIINEDSNYDEKFWDEVDVSESNHLIYNQAKTKKTDFHLGLGAYTNIEIDNKKVIHSSIDKRNKYISSTYNVNVNNKAFIQIYKKIVACSSFYYPTQKIKERVLIQLNDIKSDSYHELRTQHTEAWKQKWDESDIEIIGDIGAQQGIRFNIFHLNQTYTGKDARLNIGPKGFTGEKYGGSTYWDTEAYCLPFYLSSAPQKVAKNLLIYRHNHLQKAIENAEKLGFTNGAALYPMVTINGEECHNEWEITFEEIHRNGAIAFAIFDYIRYTGDQAYLEEFGLDVLIAIARFWKQRVNFSEAKQKYVILGVTGPNEYENNVNNNWYTNYIASWCLKFTIKSIETVQDLYPNRFLEILRKNNFDLNEVTQWEKIIDNMHYPTSEELGIFLQQDNFLDKDQTVVAKLDQANLPLNQNWSWDRILRSVYIKQADVLQGIYFFEENFDIETIRRNFEYYEPRTVHESSLSPCVHVILACLLSKDEKAYDMYLRTSRLDLDDYNNDTEDGLHITSMAGTWMSVVKGFGGMRIKNSRLYLNPRIPKNWNKLSFRLNFKNTLLAIQIGQTDISITNNSNNKINISISDQLINLNPNETKVHHL